MDVLRIDVGPSSERRGFSRLIALVRYDDGRAPPEEYWYEVPERYESLLSRSGNPWVACLLPLAVTLGEPLRIPAPVDGVLLDNSVELMRIWRSWYPRLREIEVRAPRADQPVARSATRTASLFSAGVDAFFTLLSHEPPAVPTERALAGIAAHIDDLLCVWGLDIPLTAAGEFDLLAAESEKVAREFGKESITVATNLTATRLREAGWGTLYHGAALASIGLALEGRLATVLIPSSHTYAYLNPWGSHPLTDPLFSTRGLSIRHDGAAFSRVAKTRFIAGFAAPRRSLRVCWDSRGYGNCGKCVKCYRTMTALHLLGVLSNFQTFPGASYDESRLSQFWTRDWSDESFWLELIVLAVAMGRSDLARLMERGLRRSPTLNRLYRLGAWARNQRLLRPFARPTMRVLGRVARRTLVYDDLPA